MSEFSNPPEDLEPEAGAFEQSAPADAAAPPRAGGEPVEEKLPSPPEDPEDAFRTEDGLPQYYFEEASKTFWLVNAAGDWVNLSESGFRRHLKERGKRDKGAPGKLSEIDEVIRHTEQNQRVAFAGDLAGYKRGVQTVTGLRVLVPKSPEMIVPAKGEWPTLRAYFEGLLIGKEPGLREGDPDVTINQWDHYQGWFQHVMQCYTQGVISPGLALCVAGEANSGKSRLAMIMRWCLGGRVSHPYDYMIGRDNFNKDMFGAVLQLVDDENADTNLSARLKFAAQIKKIVANDEAKQRGMHRDGVNLSVLWRLVVLVNLEANRLMVMPPVDSDIKDKVMMLKGYQRPRPPTEITLDTPAELACWPMPMPTRTEAERREFRERLQAELPAYLWWLLFEYKMPSHVAGGRFCVRHWQHPQILESLQQFSPHVRIWQLIEASGVIFSEEVGGTNGPQTIPVPLWKGTAVQLHALLVGDKSKLSSHEKKAIPDPSWLGQRLTACQQNFGEKVCVFKRTRTARLWELTNTPGLTD
jgi:hypothetical protein